MHHKRTSVLLPAASVALALFFSGVAFGETTNQPRLNVGNISLSPTPDGFYNAYVNLSVDRPNNPQVNFGVSIQHVSSLAELYGRLKPSVDQLSEELKNASFDQPSILADPNVLQNPNVLK